MLETGDSTTSPDAGRPVIHTLGLSQCRALLARNRTGRIAFAIGERVDIEPIHFVYRDGWIFGRTSPGTKAAALRHNPWVAFEVDEAEGVFDWRSVVVHGTLYFLDEDGPPSTVATREKAVALLQRLIPDLGTPFDPVAHRSLVFGIHASTYTGRASRNGA
jgi:nitroimidazol reductase NimA-like FMN-containing flavoprotein (pyridoxamine 5'-phosphate oxidase superfamily)